MQPQDQNPYDFILQQTPQNTGPNLLGSQKKKTLAIVLFLVGIAFLLIIGFAIFSALTKPNNDALIDLAAHQTEIVRVTDIGIEGVSGTEMRAKVQTLRSFLRTDLADSKALLQAKGAKVNETTFAKYFDAKVATSLTAASQRNTYNEELASILDIKIQKYVTAVQTGLSSAKTTREKALYEKAASNLVTYIGE